MLGFYFQVLGEGRLYLYAGFAAGTVIFFQSVDDGDEIRPHFCNKDSRAYRFMLIAVIFIVGLNVDAVGFEKAFRIRSR